MELGGLIEEAAALDTRLIGVSTDSVADIKETIAIVARRAPAASGLTLLSDAKAAVTSRYGLLNRGNGIAHPAMFLIGADGRVLWRYLSGHYTERAATEEVMRAVRRFAPK